MTTKYCVSHFGLYVGVFIAFLLSGCASMNSSKEELQSVGENEGIVVGSVLLTVAKGDTNESGWAFLKGRKAEDLEYAVKVSNKKEGFTLFNTPYTLPAIPGKEAFFVKKLPVGNYEMNNIGPTGFLAPTLLTFPLGLNFQVKPQETTYIGKLVAILPDRLSSGARFKFDVQDAKQETIGRLISEYPSIVPNAVTALAAPQGGSLRPTSKQFSSQWVDVIMGGMMSFPETGPALTLNLANKSTETLEVTVSFQTPDPKQRCNITSQIEKKKSVLFQCPQKSVTPNKDYPVSVAIYITDSQGNKKLAENPTTKFYFSKNDAKAFEQLIKSFE